MSEQLHYAKQGAVATIHLNRPEKKNAITTAMYQAMVEALGDAKRDDAVMAVGITGGDNFTAGNDIGDFIAAGSASAGEWPVLGFLQAISTFPKPLVAGVKGVAIGIGTTLLMHCDAVVAGRSSRFSLPFAKLGLVPEAGSSLLFPLIAGRMKASWYLLSGEQFGAEEADRIGLLTRVVDDKDVDDAVSMMCGMLAELPPNALRETKRLLKAPVADAVSKTIETEVQSFIAALRGEEARNALMSFMRR